MAKELFILYQTDQWNTKASRVCLGIFNSFELANKAAKENKLYAYNPQGTGAEIKSVILNQFKEVV